MGVLTDSRIGHDGPSQRHGQHSEFLRIDVTVNLGFATMLYRSTAR